MAAIMPNTPGTGNNIPISNYVAGITESYPNVNRQRTVESSINSKETIDFLPTNIGINQSISDKYLEFRINGTVGSFLDLSSIIMELQLKPLNTVDGSSLKDEDLISFVNGLRGCRSLLEIVFVGQCEVLVCLDLDLFFFLGRKAHRCANGVNSLKMSIFWTYTPLSYF